MGSKIVHATATWDQEQGKYVLSFLHITMLDWKSLKYQWIENEN